jgi:uncharacterized protein (TIGR00369 family)
MTQTQDDTRTRTFSWADPVLHASALGRSSGLETLQSMVNGEMPPPPVMRMLGMGRMDVGEGTVTVTLEPQEFHYNPLGSVHGGVLATLLDTGTGCAVHTTLPAGTGYTSLDLNTRFLRAVTVRSGTLTCVGTVIARGRRTATAEARITDGRGALVAHATSTCLLMEVPTTP